MRLEYNREPRKILFNEVNGEIQLPIDTDNNTFFSRNVSNEEKKIVTPLDYLKIDELTENDVENLKAKMKEIEKKVKEKNKPKTITISGIDHSIIKSYCNSLNLNIGEWTAKVLIEEIERNRCITYSNETYEEIQEAGVKNIREKYKYLFEESENEILLKSNKLILSKDLKIKGYSFFDGKPIYEISFDNRESFLDYVRENDIDVVLCKKNEISNEIIPTEDMDFIIK